MPAEARYVSCEWPQPGLRSEGNFPRSTNKPEGVFSETVPQPKAGWRPDSQAQGVQKQPHGRLAPHLKPCGLPQNCPNTALAFPATGLVRTVCKLRVNKRRHPCEYELYTGAAEDFFWLMRVSWFSVAWQVGEAGRVPRTSTSLSDYFHPICLGLPGSSLPRTTSDATSQTVPRRPAAGHSGGRQCVLRGLEMAWKRYGPGQAGGRHPRLAEFWPCCHTAMPWAGARTVSVCPIWRQNQPAPDPPSCPTDGKGSDPLFSRTLLTEDARNVGPRDRKS